MLRWLWHDPTDLGTVTPWDPVRAEREAAATARMLLGAAGPAVKSGSRRDEQIVQEREQRLQVMRERQQRRDRFRKVG